MAAIHRTWQCSPFCHLPCGWQGQGKRSCTLSSVETTVAPTSLSGATTLALERTRPGRTSTGRSTRRNCFAGTNASWVSRWCLSGAWCTWRRPIPMEPADEVPKGSRILDLSGTELRGRLAEGREIPGWFTFPEVASVLRASYPSRACQGFTVFFTGLPGSGKSTVANVLLVRLLETGPRRVTLLDGDIVRKNLSSELGFSREHRDINILRIRVRSVRDHQAPGHRHLCANRPLRVRAPKGPRLGRAARRLHPCVSGNPA